jgi:hypothetical protein
VWQVIEMLGCVAQQFSCNGRLWIPSLERRNPGDGMQSGSTGTVQNTGTEHRYSERV